MTTTTRSASWLLMAALASAAAFAGGMLTGCSDEAANRTATTEEASPTGREAETEAPAEVESKPVVLDIVSDEDGRTHRVKSEGQTLLVSVFGGDVPSPERLEDFLRFKREAANGGTEPPAVTITAEEGIWFEVVCRAMMAADRTKWRITLAEPDGTPLEAKITLVSRDPMSALRRGTKVLGPRKSDESTVEAEARTRDEESYRLDLVHIEPWDKNLENQAACIIVLNRHEISGDKELREMLVMVAESMAENPRRRSSLTIAPDMVVWYKHVVAAIKASIDAGITDIRIQVPG